MSKRVEGLENQIGGVLTTISNISRHQILADTCELLFSRIPKTGSLSDQEVVLEIMLKALNLENLFSVIIKIREWRAGKEG